MPVNCDVHVSLAQCNLDLTNLYTTKFLVPQAIFSAPVIVKYVEKNFDMTKPP